MEKSKFILGIKKPGDFSVEERKMVIEDYLKSGRTKTEIWKKHTGMKSEHGYILLWMRQLGYSIPSKITNFVNQNSINMANKKVDSIENIEMKEKIAALEKALLNSELRATALETMIEVAEKELKINIRKKSFTKQSIK